MRLSRLLRLGCSVWFALVLIFAVAELLSGASAASASVETSSSPLMLAAPLVFLPVLLELAR